MITNRAKVIRCLLQHPILPTWEITKCTGYTKMGLERARPSLSRELIALEKGRYIEEIKNPNDYGQERQKHYQINRDFSIIITLYNQKEYFEIREEFRKSVWLMNHILSEHLQIDENLVKRDFIKMFEYSPSFFEFCLNPNFNKTHLTHLVELFDSDVSNKRDITGAFDTEIKERIPNYVIYDIFLLFCFQDNISTIFQTGADNPLIKFIGEIRTKSLEEKRRIRDYNSTIDLMTALLAFYHYLRANNVSVPSELDRKIDTYYHDLDHYKRIKENPDFKYNVDMEKAKLARQYNIIAKILELGIERQERKKKTNTSRVIISPLQVP